MVIWPLVIHYHSDDELTFVADENEWSQDCDVHFHAYTEGDEMIDADGHVFHLKPNVSGKQIVINESGRIITLSEFESLVKKHLVSQDQCCTSKLKLSSIRDGMSLIQQL